MAGMANSAGGHQFELGGPPDRGRPLRGRDYPPNALPFPENRFGLRVMAGVQVPTT